MLTIRAQQLQVFTEKYEQKRLDDIIDRLYQCYPETTGPLSRQEVKDRVRTGRAEAEHRGIRSPANVERYVHLMFVLNECELGGSCQIDWVATILGWPDADEDFKMAALERRARAESIVRLQRQMVHGPAAN